jgi:hypothetical protein
MSGKNPRGEKKQAQLSLKEKRQLKREKADENAVKARKR